MRTVQTPTRVHVFTRKTRTTRTSALQKGRIPRTTYHFAAVSGMVFLCALFFILGYLPGIFVGQGGKSELGQQLATYYTGSAKDISWGTSFYSQMLSAFLQHFSVLLCGFSPFGMVLLFLLFLAKGSFLGFCAANVLAVGGVKSLVVYWLLWCLPSLVILFLSLWLAGYAIPVSRGLFQSAFQGGAPRGQLNAAVRRLAVRFLTAMFFSCLFSAVFSGVFILVNRLLW